MTGNTKGRPAFYIVFIHGPAAAGKHTIGSLVSERLQIPLFHNHLTVDLVKTLFEFGTPPFIELRADLWRSAFRAAAAAGRSFVFTFNPENTVDPALIGDLAACVEDAGGEVLYVELRCADEEIIRRINNPSRRRFSKLTDAAVYRQAKQAGGFNFPPLPPPLLCIDTGVTPAADAAQQIVQAVSAS